MSQDRRRATRIDVDFIARIEVLGEPTVEPLPNFVTYERVPVPTEMAGRRFQGRIRDISINGARVTADEIPPLLSRLAVQFVLPGFGQAVVLGLLMWRRAAAEVLRPEQPPLALEQSFGFLFEAASLETRQAIAMLIEERQRG
jgi:hypothetical protein